MTPRPRDRAPRAITISSTSQTGRWFGEGRLHHGSSGAPVTYGIWSVIAAAEMDLHCNQTALEERELSASAYSAWIVDRCGGGTIEERPIKARWVGQVDGLLVESAMVDG
ncbi:hypothetical protein GWK47_011220 [Chionoecetes opilio]|uniref:Uncharacterized protein n=1 Tax=Chionoecetes opilio TaxID=41210 RepID=A0A8J5CML6_CHIOP|nr:hypothetical protein GWK47_011220 [Chionoecetes opilio]